MKLKITTFNILMIISVVCFRPAGLLMAVPWMKIVYAFLEVVAFFVAFNLAIKNKVFVHKVFVSALVFFAYNVLNTVFHFISIQQIGSIIATDFTILLVVLVVKKKGFEKRFILQIDSFFNVMLFVNFFHMFFTDIGFGYTRSMNKIYFLCSDNALIIYLIVFIVIHLYRNSIKAYSKVANFLYFMVCAYELIKGDAATSFFVICVLLVLAIMSKVVDFSILKYLFIILIFFANYFILVVRKFDFLASIVVLLGKNLSFSGRTEIWDKAISMAHDSLVWGYGVYDNVYYVKRYGVLMEAHNMLLSYTLQGGIFLLALFIIFLLITIKELFRHSNRNNNLIFVGLVSYLVAFLVESPACITGFFMLIGLSADYDIEKKY